MRIRPTFLCRRFAALCIAVLPLVSAGTAPAATREAPRATIKPPTANVVETIGDQRIADPYRPLENLEAPNVQRWFRSQSQHARAILDSIPGRNALVASMREFDTRKAEKVYNLSITDNDRYFYLKQRPEDETGRLFFRNGFRGEERMLFDPSTFSGSEGARYVISTISPNLDGSKIAMTVSPNGSEDALLLIMEVGTGKLYPERIDRCWFASPSWLPDGTSFFYNRLRQGTLHDKDREKESSVLLHKAGTDPIIDRPILSRATNPELQIRPEEIPAVDYDRKSNCLFAYISSVDKRLNVLYAPASALKEKSVRWTRLFSPKDGIYDFTTTKDELYLLTPNNASRFTLLKTSLQHPDLQHAETVIPEHPEASLTGFALTSSGICYTLSFNGVREELFLKEYRGGQAQKIDLPFAAGNIRMSSKGYDYPDFWTVMAGWSHDYHRYRVDPATRSFSDETLSSPARYPEYENLTVEELMIPSHDGVSVPLSLIYGKGMAKNGRNPVLLYGYGAYGKTLSPFFSPAMLLWVHKGGILAIAHVRGGGELGDGWHKAGMKTAKPNTWKDLIACTEYLVSHGYTSREHTAINGASAGGIMVGRAMTERPDLFAAAIPQVGVLNPLRGEETPNGPVNAPEFGTVGDPVECRALIEMDPYLHLKKGVSYPATLITSGMNDPRVIAWQPAKFAARLQALTASTKPALFFTDYRAGHGVGDTKTRQIETLADLLSFGLWQTGHPEFQPK